MTHWLRQIVERLFGTASYAEQDPRACVYKETRESDECGSGLFTLHEEELDQGNLCDVHYWKSQAYAYRDAFNIAAHDIQVILPRILAKQQKEEP